MSTRVLVVEDDLFVAEGLKRLLGEQGYDVVVAGTAESGWNEIELEQPSIVLLDLGLPDQDGVLLCRRIRAKWNVPVLMLTSRGQAAEKVLGLESGADDYLPKPFEPQELIARIRAVLRRTSPKDAEPAKLRFGDITIDEAARTVTVGRARLELTETEYKIVVYLATNSGRAIGREQIFESVWGYDMDFNSNSLEVLVYRLRHKMQESGAGNPIKTLRGYGYMWEA